MAKKLDKKSVLAHFHLVLDVGVSMGSLSLEDALAKAKATKIEDIVDLSALDFNDGEIEVTGVFHA